ncbi:MAG: asparaginase [Deltaproteobacteria bacterium]|nr:asparaginase [Deltaproteobacteria bacterium]
MRIKIFTIGGTIDKIYFDKKSNYEVGQSKIADVLEQARVNFDYECISLMQKDSLDMTDEDRQRVFDAVREDEERLVVITHGTDTMVDTARKLLGIEGKVIVLTGAMEPARFKSSDAEFNIGSAIGAVQALPEGVYIAMNGRIFRPDRTRKNVEQNRFEDI